MSAIGPGLYFLGLFIWLGLLDVAKAIREHGGVDQRQKPKP